MLLRFIDRPFFYGERRFVGPHDPQVPYQAALNAAEIFKGSGIGLWNWYDQLDVAFSQLTFGWWTIPSLVEGGILYLLDEAIGLDGYQVTIVHANLLVIISTVTASFGLHLLLHDLKIRPVVSVPVVSVCLSLMTGVQILYYVTGFLYSLFPLLLVALRRSLVRMSPASAVPFCALATVAIGQSPLFAVGYLFVPLFLFVCVEAAFHVVLRSRVTDEKKCTAKVWISTKASAQSNEPELNWPQRIMYVYLCAMILAVIALLGSLYLSIQENLYFVTNRVNNGFWSRSWFLETLNKGTDPGATLIASSTGIHLGWPYLGIALPLLAVFGIVISRQNPTARLGLVGLLTLSMTMSSIQDVSLRWVGVPARLLLFIFYPGSIITNNYSMLTWLGFMCTIPAICVAVQSALSDSRPEIKVRSALLAGISVTAISWSVGQTLNATVISVAGLFGGALIAVLHYQLQRGSRRPNLRQMYWLSLVLLATAIFLDVRLAREVVNREPYFAVRVEPRSFEFDEFSSARFVPEFRDLRSAITPPLIYRGSLPSTTPLSRSVLFPRDETSLYFDPQVNSGLFWNTNILRRYDQDLFYQQVHSTMREQALNASFSAKEFVSWVAQDSNDCDAIYDWTQSTLMEQTVIPLNFSDLRKLQDPVGSSASLVAFELPASIRGLQTSVFLAASGRMLIYSDDRKFSVVQGLPAENWSVDVGNFLAGSVTLRVPDVESVPERLLLVTSSNIGFGQSLRAVEIGRDELKVRIASTREGCIVVAQPWQRGWRATVDGRDVAVLTANGLVAVHVPSGHSELLLRYEPFGAASGYIPIVYPAGLTFLLAFAIRRLSGPKVGR